MLGSKRSITGSANRHCDLVVALASLVRILGECSTIQHLPVCVCVCVCFEVEISSHTLIPLFMPGSVHSGSVN